MNQKEQIAAEEIDFVQNILRPVEGRKTVNRELSEAFSGGVHGIRKTIGLHAAVVCFFLAIAIEHLVQYGQQGGTWDITSGIMFSIFAIWYAVSQALIISRRFYRIKIIEAFLIKGTREELTEFLAED